MSARTTAHNLQVDNRLYDFVNSEVLPDLGMDQAAFWAGFSQLVTELAPKNIALLAERDRLQTELDTWHKAHPGPILDMKGYRAFLEALATSCRLTPRHRPARRTWTPSWPRRPARSWWCRS